MDQPSAPPFEWLSTTAPIYRHAEAKRPGGVWQVNHPRDVCPIHWAPDFPDGMDIIAVMNAAGDLPISDPERWRYAAMMSNATGGHNYAASHGEARRVCEWLEHHGGVDGTVESILSAGGFQKGRAGGHSIMFERRVGSGFFTLFWADGSRGTEHLHLTYAGPRSGRWWNLLRLTVQTMNHNGSFAIPCFWPSQITNPMATFARVAVEYADMRAANGPRRYKNPTID